MSVGAHNWIRLCRLIAWLLLLLAMLAQLADSRHRQNEASAATAAAPAWGVEAFAYPSNFASDENTECNFSETAVEALCDTYTITASNIGAEQTAGGTAASVTIEDALPRGVTARKVSLLWSGLSEVKGRSEAEDLGPQYCTLVPLRCHLPGTFFSEAGRRMKPDDTLKMWVSVTVDSEPAAVESVSDRATVSGGGAAEVATATSNTIGGEPPPFDLDSFSSPLLAVDGTPDMQAGSHPYELPTQINLRSSARETPEGAAGATTIHDIRDVIVDLPLGLAGSAISAPTCTLHELSSRGPKDETGKSGCPVNAEVGHIRTYPTGFLSANSPLYNIVPERGVAAEFGFVDNAGGSHVLYASIAPTPSGYVLRTTTREVPQVPLTQITADVYGDPAARARAHESGTPYAPAASDPSTFTNPDSCTGEPLKTTVHIDSWFEPGSYNADGTPDFEDPRWASKAYEAPPVSGCSALEGLFKPAIEATPQSSDADSPTGLDVDLEVPQSDGPETLGTPPLRDAAVALPEGMSVNPSSANGLEACSLSQVGISASGLPNAAPPACPDGSKIGTLELETPALPAEACKEAGKGLGECPQSSEREKTPLDGSIYVARQGENPFGSLLTIYIVVDDPRTGVIVKLPAEVKANEATGQLTTVVRNSPQFPFSELRTHFFGGATASLRTPPTCGAYAVTSELTPWSAPESGPPATPSGPFQITQGPGGGSCARSAAQEPNSPAFEASTSPTAGAYSPLLVQLNREDGSQNFSQISVTLPPGATGKLAGIPKCSEAQIAAAQARDQLGDGALELASPSCPASSRIGTVTVGAGAGPHPFYVSGGAFLAGPYKGAPFSAVFITPALAGPFDLGVVVVRAGLYVDPHTAQVTTRSDPLPSILHGIPLDIRSVAVDVDRPGFTLNPTNCTTMAATGEETSTQGNVAPLSSRFQVGGCAGLPFRPKLTASVVGRASKADGASFSVDVTSAGIGQANIAKVELQLPKALPSRLSTLQKACLSVTFESNPASCSSEAVIGMATIHTPLLKSPLSGPAYLVSHGSAAFPDVEFVLQGEGVELILDGKTDIKKGITYSKFESTPDAPFTTFETKLPAGPHGVLTANVAEKEHFSLCKANLAMPTEIVGQNGAVIRQTTKIVTSGCRQAEAGNQSAAARKSSEGLPQGQKEGKAPRLRTAGAHALRSEQEARQARECSQAQAALTHRRHGRPLAVFRAVVSLQWRRESSFFAGISGVRRATPLATRLRRLRRPTYDRHPIQPFEFGLGGHQYLNR